MDEELPQQQQQQQPGGPCEILHGGFSPCSSTKDTHVYLTGCEHEHVFPVLVCTSCLVDLEAGVGWCVRCVSLHGTCPIILGPVVDGNSEVAETPLPGPEIVRDALQ
jgi:hypothetical protein